MCESGLRTKNENKRQRACRKPRHTRFAISTIDRLALTPEPQLIQQG